MKNFIKDLNYLFLLFVPFLMVGCGDDDSDDGGGNPAPINVRIVSANPDTDTYTIKNFGDEAVDISMYRLCSEFNYTANLSGQTLVSGSLLLDPDAEVTLSGFSTDDQADLGLYLATGGFEDAVAMVDFVQWGSPGNGRESVAVEKGIWTAGDFIEGMPPFEYTGSGTQDGENFWNAAPVVSTPDIRIVKVMPGSDTYELMNFSSAAVDVSDYLLCSKFQYSDVLSTLTVVEGDLNLQPAGTVTLSGFPIEDDAADVGLYLPGTTDFAVVEQMVDFLQYGSAANGRESVAAAAGIWTAGDFLPTSDYYEYTGDGSQDGINFWQENNFSGANIRLVMVDPANDTYVIKNFGDQSLDISDFRLCSKFVYQQTLTTLTLNSGSLNLDPNAEVNLSGFAIDDTAADLGLYLSSASGGFGEQSAMLDFVQWGSAGNGRESVADGKGIWTAGDFVTGAGPFSYSGDGTQNGLTFWQ